MPRPLGQVRCAEASELQTEGFLKRCNPSILLLAAGLCLLTDSRIPRETAWTRSCERAALPSPSRMWETSAIDDLAGSHRHFLVPASSYLKGYLHDEPRRSTRLPDSLLPKP
jgi:hypothetical protein